MNRRHPLYTNFQVQAVTEIAHKLDSVTCPTGLDETCEGLRIKTRIKWRFRFHNTVNQEIVNSLVGEVLYCLANLRDS